MTFPRKPALGDPCNGCGMCCVAEPCPIALDYVEGAEFGKPCPALEWQDGRSWCGVIRDPHHYGAPPLFAVAGPSILGDGSCDSGPALGFMEDRDVGYTAADYLNLQALGLR